MTAGIGPQLQKRRIGQDFGLIEVDLEPMEGGFDSVGGRFGGVGQKVFEKPSFYATDGHEYLNVRVIGVYSLKNPFINQNNPIYKSPCFGFRIH